MSRCSPWRVWGPPSRSWARSWTTRTFEQRAHVGLHPEGVSGQGPAGGAPAGGRAFWQITS
eukprot:7223235-Lingulodinium_polyedra.AAC.1